MGVADDGGPGGRMVPKLPQGFGELDDWPQGWATSCRVSAGLPNSLSSQDRSAGLCKPSTRAGDRGCPSGAAYDAA